MARGVAIGGTSHALGTASVTSSEPKISPPSAVTFLITGVLGAGARERCACMQGAPEAHGEASDTKSHLRHTHGRLWHEKPPVQALTRGNTRTNARTNARATECNGMQRNATECRGHPLRIGAGAGVPSPYQGLDWMKPMQNVCASCTILSTWAIPPAISRCWLRQHSVFMQVLTWKAAPDPPASGRGTPGLHCQRADLNTETRTQYACPREAISYSTLPYEHTHTATCAALYSPSSPLPPLSPPPPYMPAIRTCGATSRTGSL